MKLKIKKIKKIELHGSDFIYHVEIDNKLKSGQVLVLSREDLQ